MAKKGQKHNVAGVPKRFFFHLVAFDIRNVVYLGCFKGTIEACKKKI